MPLFVAYFAFCVKNPILEGRIKLGNIFSDLKEVNRAETDCFG